MSDTTVEIPATWAGGSVDVGSTNWIVGFVEYVPTTGAPQFVSWVYGNPQQIGHVAFLATLTADGVVDSAVGSSGTLADGIDLPRPPSDNTQYSILVNNPGATYDLSKSWYIDSDGTGLTIEAGNLVLSGPTASINVSEYPFPAPLTIGQNGVQGAPASSLTVSDGGIVSVAGDVHLYSGQPNTLLVSGNGSALNAGTGFLISAQATINDGASVSAEYGGDVDSGGTLSVIGAGSSLNIFGDGSGDGLYVGDTSYSTGVGILTGGMLAVGGGASVEVTGGITINEVSSVFGNGLITANISNLGAIEASGGTLDLNGAISGTGTATIDTGSALDVAGAIAGQTITFADATGTLDIGDLAGSSATIESFQPGDMLEFGGITATATTFDQTTGALTFENISGATTADVGTIDVVGSYDPSWFHIAETDGTAILTDAPCFAGGTRILTDHGAVAVEALRIGDRVRSHFRQCAAVTWLGHRRVDCARHPRPWDVRPVRVQAGAFGASLPQRDLLLSPDHAVFVAGKLIPIRYLVNGATVTQEVIETVTYWHVELSRHDVIFAEGLPCESYLDTGNRAAFANGGTVAQAHPDFAQRVWDADSCALLVLAGPVRDLVYRRLLAQAFALGHRLTQNPGLHLSVDGRIVRPRTIGHTHHFRLPRRAGVAKLVSRGTVPAWVRPDSDDHRRLGVAVARVVLDGQAISLVDARFGGGWHAPEADGGWRWTNGDAALDVAGARTLAVEVAITEQYWLAPRRTRARAA